MNANERKETYKATIGRIRSEVLKSLDRKIEHAEANVRNALDFLTKNVADAQREMSEGRVSSNGFILRSSSTYEVDLATVQAYALKEARREIAAIINFATREKNPCN